MKSFMSRIHIVEPDAHSQAWQVWISLENEHGIEQGEAFIIGSGATRDEAVAGAVADLEAQIEQLQGAAVV